MNRSEFLSLLADVKFTEAQERLQEKILRGEFTAQDLKHLAIVLEKQNKNIEALTYLKIVERVSVSDSELDQILAYTFDKTGQYAFARPYFEKIIKNKSNDWLLQFKLGDLYFKLAQYPLAIQAFIQARNLNPSDISIYFALYKTFLKLEKHKECLFVIEEALKLNQQLPDLYLNAGLVAAQIHDYEKALNYLHRCIELAPSPGGYLNLGNLYKQLARIEDAIQVTTKSIELAPNYVMGYQNLCIDYNYFWEKKAKTFAVAKKYGEVVSSSAKSYTTWLTQKIKNKKLRIGFVSGDFRLHPVSHFIVNVLDSIPRDQFDLIAYYNGEIVDSMTRTMRSKFTEWNPAVNLLSDAKLAKKIYEDKIDILIDLAGHTAKTRTSMFAFKPAPVQVNWLGYFNTTGLKQIDWVIADKIVLPEKDRRYYTEKPYYMPEIYYAYSKPSLIAPISEPPNLHNGYITLGCFNNHPKLNHKVIATWSEILSLIPDAKMMIKNRQLESQYIKDSLIKSFVDYGIDPSRLILEKASHMREYYQAYNKIDIALDPFPFPGGTTSIDGLWMGVPVVTLSGNTFIGRQGETILKNMKMDDWVAYSQEEYIELAVKKSKLIMGDKQYKENIRKKIEISAVMDTTRFAGHLCEAFQVMWQHYCKK